jgi:hypothetical protein
MGPAEVRADFSGALSAIIVVALIVATTAVMLVTLNTKAAAVAGLGPVLIASQHADVRITTGAVAALARPADRR